MENQNKFLLLEANKSESVFAKYFNQFMGCFVEEEDNKTLVYFPLALLPRLNKNQEKRVLRAIRTFGTSMMLGRRRLLKSTIVTNQALGYFVPETKPTNTLRNFINYYK